MVKYHFMVALQRMYVYVNSNSQFKVHTLLICLIKTPERRLLSSATDYAITFAPKYIYDENKKKKEIN
jgi:hypothetical protein